MEKNENEKISVTSSTSLIDNSLKKSPVQIKDTHSDKIKKTAVICIYIYTYIIYVYINLQTFMYTSLYIYICIYKQ
jgi:hypothetical protein